jgi:hypothetical protein
MSDPIIDLKRELLAAAERQLRHVPAPVRHRRFRDRVQAPRLLLGGAAVAVAAAAALFFTTPWSSSPGFLAKAQAALTPPKGKILHMKTQTTVISTDPRCTITQDPVEIWIDQTPPYMHRAIIEGPPPSITDARVAVCSRWKPIEIGGPLSGPGRLTFVPPNTLSDTGPSISIPHDPVAWLREAINTGHAHDEGKTTLDGRTVELIRIDPTSPPNCPTPCPRAAQEPHDVYVDPDTYQLVETRGPAEIVLNNEVLVNEVVRYLKFEYLPRTDANLALTDIRAQHPSATGP